MALFAAYAETSKTANEKEPEQEWLQQSSFCIDVNPTIEKIETEEPPRKKKKEKKERKKIALTVEKHDEFEIDTKRTPEYNNVRTIARPSAPKYKLSGYINDGRFRNKWKSKRLKRYFQFAVDKPDGSGDEAKITKADLSKSIEINKDVNYKGFIQEEDLSKTTAYYNKALGEDTHNIEMWIKYVNFQDSIFQFEKTYRKGSIVKGLRVTAERKLSILDKALSHNSNNSELMRMRINIAVSVYPSDELQTHLYGLVEKDQSNIIFWQGFIEATQCSMSHCNTPAVLALYIKCLHSLHTLRRTAKLEKAQLEESILRILYQCGLFLKQTGCFEQLWTLLRLYLELNLSPNNDSRFNTSVSCNEKQLVELEEVVLNSQLPIHELWLRVEKLREACHWLPLSVESEDPQRVVFSEDVSELIHPITIAGNSFRLTVTVLTLLKIPLLPCRHSTMQDFGTDYVPWSLDSIESLLPMFLPLYPIDLHNTHFLKHAQKLAVGPQFLRTFPGQEEYLRFVLTIMKICISCLAGSEKNALYIWWFRFQRLLLALEKVNMLNISAAMKKSFKTNMKEVLKENPSNVILFREFALFECESDNMKSAKNILLTSISMNQKAKRALDDELVAAFRTLIELHFCAGEDLEANKQACLRMFINFMQGKSLNELPKFMTQGALNEVRTKFAEKSAELIYVKLQGDQHFLPDFTVEWTILQGWFLYLTSGLDETRVFVENALSKAQDLQKEYLQEFLIAVLFRTESFASLDRCLETAIAEHPNNLFFLSVLAKVQSLHTCMGKPWWRIKTLLLNSGHAMATLFSVLILQQSMSILEGNCVDTITGQIVNTEGTFKNRLLSLFKRLTSSDMCTRRCGLVWRLYLQFLHGYYDLKVCRDAYYAAVEECPWFKALYIDAAIYIPEELPQIQDLIIEKQLRIHVTPEELDVLRN